MTNNKTQKGKFHPRNHSKNNFGIAEHQEAGTFGLGYKLTLTGNTDNVVLNKVNAINNAKSQIIAMQLYVPHYTPSLEQQNMLLNEITKKMATKLQYPERSVLMKIVNTEIL